MPSAPEPAPQAAQRNVLWRATSVLVANGSGAVLTLIAQVVLARWLGVAAYGLYVYALAWVALLGLLAIRGADGATLRFVATYAGQGLSHVLARFMRFSSRRALTGSLAVGTLAALTASALGERLAAGGTIALGCAALLLIPNVALQVNASELVALGRPALANILQGVARPILLLAVLAAWQKFSSAPVAASQALLANALACLAVLAFAANRARHAVRGVRAEVRDVNPDRSNDDTEHWRAVSGAMFGMALGQTIISQADMLLLGALGGTTAAGVYGVAARLASLVSMGVVSVESILAPQIADLYARQRFAELQAAVTHAARLTLWWSALTIAVLAVVARPLLALFGPEFVEAAPLLLPLAGAQLVIAASGSVGFLLSMTGHQRDALRAVNGCAALTVILNVALIPSLGAWGAAIGMLVATAARSLALTYLVRNRLRIRPSALGW